ncbi:MAG TPA: methyltransferase domain-containing protein [Candidatus Dormibacteraeota bacterium]|nr:methyltransferase domain-containing protein [Candidatus Dormibacteraeota bacterium]
MIDHLRTTGSLHLDAVERAFLAVPRHLFIPHVPLEQAYEDAAVPIKTDADGHAISSSSQPSIMALMLEQLRLTPGSRVLEIGTGSGYNAALCRQLVGGEGSVTSVDIDPDVSAAARRHLAAAGVDGVEVICADGAEGWPGSAPYDAVIVTASSDDIPPAWTAQLAPAARLVLPLRLRGPIQFSVAFIGHIDHLESEAVHWCTFMPIRGELQRPNGAAPRTSSRRWLVEEPHRTETTMPAAGLGSFESWLALTDGRYLSVLLGPGRGLAFGIADEDGAALLEAEDDLVRVGLYGVAERLAADLIAAYRRWRRQRPSPDQLHIDAFPSTAHRVGAGGGSVFRRRHVTFLVRWPA